MEGRQVYELQAEVYKALSNPTRLMIIECIGTDRKSVAQIVDCLGLSKSNVSQHLNYMKALGILCSQKEGKNVYYYLSDPALLEALRSIREILFNRFVKCGQIMGAKAINLKLGS